MIGDHLAIAKKRSPIAITIKRSAIVHALIMGHPKLALLVNLLAKHCLFKSLVVPWGELGIIILPELRTATVNFITHW